MDVKLALLADAANVSREGKLNILGVFDAIYARQFPTVHPHMALVLRFEAGPAEKGTARHVEVQLVAADGRVLVNLPGHVNLAHPGAGEPAVLDHVLSFTNTRFEAPGRYTLRVAVDGVVAAALRLRVEQLPPAH